MIMIIKVLDRLIYIGYIKMLVKKSMALLFFAVLLSGFLKGQDIVNAPGLNYTLPPESGEKITICTDRTLYIVTEKIHFTAGYLINPELGSLDWSNVLYVELIRWNGEKIARSKFTLDRPGAEGYLEIPGDALSGFYYIRAYTRWMRNYPANEYGYAVLKIVNPFKQDIDPGPDEQVNHVKNITEKTLSEKRKKSILCETSKTVYKPREQVELDMIVNKEISDNQNDYCISVVRAGSLDTSYSNPVCQSVLMKQGKINFLPEIRGISVTGNVMEKSSGKPLKNVTTYLSIPIGGEYFSVFSTDEQGRFLFTLPYIEGDFDFFIEVLTNEEVEAEIRIDNDFCNVPVTLPYIQFDLNKNEEKLVQEMMINRQLEEKFGSHPVDTTTKGKITRPVAFYGTPQSIFYMEKYIELNDLEEFIFELVPQVIVYHRKGKPYIRIEKQTGLSDLTPLVLIDDLPVSNIGQLLKAPVYKLERIEIIDQGYVAGNKIFNGLISVYSKNKDFAGIEMGKNSMFFNYSLYSGNTYLFPACNGDSEKSRIPDRRNPLYWNPHVYLSSGKTSDISFYTSDSKGEYIVYVRSINSKNKPGIYGTCRFTVE
jgi:hypothetical protein